MSEESKSNAPANPAPIGEIEHGPSKFDQFMENNLKKLIFLALLIIVGVAAFVITSQLADAKAREAGNALLAAESPEDYRKVSKDYPDSGAAASAQLLLAGQLWEEGKESEAAETLKGLTSSDHPASAKAEFTLAGFLLKQGKTEEAQSVYEAVLANSEAKYLHPFTLVALGDIAAAAGDEEKARELYQRKLDDYQGYADQNIAVTRLNLVGVDSPEKVPAPPAPDPAANPNSGIPSSFTTPLPNPSAAPSMPIPAPALESAPPAVEVTPAPAAEEPSSPAPVEEAETSQPTEEPTPPAPPAPAEETPTFEAPQESEE